MSLVDALKQLSKDGFDPKEAAKPTPKDLPDGKYTMILDRVQHGKQHNNRDYLMIGFKVFDGKYANWHENIFPTLDETTSTGKAMPTFVLERSIRQIQTIGALTGADVPNDCFMPQNEGIAQNYDLVVNHLNQGIGKMLQVRIYTTENKKNPDRPYRNYAFGPAQQQPELEKVDKPLPHSPQPTNAQKAPAKNLPKNTGTNDKKSDLDQLFPENTQTDDPNAVSEDDAKSLFPEMDGSDLNQIDDFFNSNSKDDQPSL